jgi:hypothetical protein
VFKNALWICKVADIRNLRAEVEGEKALVTAHFHQKKGQSKWYKCSNKLSEDGILETECFCKANGKYVPLQTLAAPW